MKRFFALTLVAVFTLGTVPVLADTNVPVADSSSIMNGYQALKVEDGANKGDALANSYASDSFVVQYNPRDLANNTETICQVYTFLKPEWTALTTNAEYMNNLSKFKETNNFVFAVAYNQSNPYPEGTSDYKDFQNYYQQISSDIGSLFSLDELDITSGNITLQNGSSYKVPSDYAENVAVFTEEPTASEPYDIIYEFTMLPKDTSTSPKSAIMFTIDQDTYSDPTLPLPTVSDGDITFLDRNIAYTFNFLANGISQTSNDYNAFNELQNEVYSKIPTEDIGKVVDISSNGASAPNSSNNDEVSPGGIAIDWSNENAEGPTQVDISVDNKPIISVQGLMTSSGKPLIPLRQVAEGIGDTVTWNSADNTATVLNNGQVVAEVATKGTYTSDNYFSSVTGEEPVLINGITYVSVETVKSLY